MRSFAFVSRLPFAAALAATPFALNPVFAQDQEEVVFVSGTGDAEYVDVIDNEADGGDYRDGGSSINDMAGKLSDPATQYGVAATVERATAAMMDLPVAPIAEAIESAWSGTVNRRVRRDTTIGDLAGRDAAYLPEELAGRSREMMGMMGGFAQAVAMMMPEFRKLGREMEESWRTAKEQSQPD